MLKHEAQNNDAGTIEALSAIEGPSASPAPIETDAASPPLPITQGGFDQPGWMWAAMFGFYGIFFLSILLATGRDVEALFAIVISILYALFYFGVAGVLGALQGPNKGSPLERGDGVMQTWTGPMSRSAVAAQILGVPLALALFGVLFAIIRAVVAP